jgi:hypothetical protein
MLSIKGEGMQTGIPSNKIIIEIIHDIISQLLIPVSTSLRAKNKAKTFKLQKPPAPEDL